MCFLKLEVSTIICDFVKNEVKAKMLVFKAKDVVFKNMYNTHILIFPTCKPFSSMGHVCSCTFERWKCGKS